MKLLCATDLQARSDAAVDRATQLRDALGASLTLIHVVTPVGADQGTLEQRLLSATSRLALRARHAGANTGMGNQLIVRVGRPSTVITEEARSADLAIIGPHRNAGMTDALRGTSIERLLGEARRPVLMVRQPVRAPYRSVLLALDGSPVMARIVRLAERLLPAADVELAAVHAHEPPYEAMMNSIGVGNLSVAQYASESMSQAAATIHAELRRHSRDVGRYRLMLVDSRPGPAIRRAVREMRPDLLVLGTRGHGRFRRALLGSTAHEALRESECDVLIVPEGAVRMTHPAGDDSGPRAA